MRVIQTNLQITDAVNLDAERLADQVLDLGANAIVFNVGGIYAWYPTKVPYHTKNPLMAPDRDIVGEMTAACRKRDIRFIARYDFSKAEDNTYRQHPEWFVRLEENKPQLVAVDRFGNWPLLVSTCLNGGYQNEEVAFKVLKESMERYHPDGIFITSMIYAPCLCERCKKVYRDLFGAELPADPRQYAPGFAEKMMDESVKRYDRLVKSIDPDAAFLHRCMLDNGRMDRNAVFQASRWWFPDAGEYDVFFDHPIDLIHGETHNVLTGGRRQIGARWGAGAATKLARCLPNQTEPIDIVHTAPGLNWRHTGMPAAEHRFWISQVPANGGQVWHSLTGIPDNILDQEQLDSVRWVDERIRKAEPFMHGAQSAADVALLWNNISGHGWIEGLTAARIPFDLLLQRQIEKDGIPGRYRYLICPERQSYMPSTVKAIEAYAKNGGHVILEGRIHEPALLSLAGLCGPQQESEMLHASYLRLENRELQTRAGVAGLVPFAGKALYCRFEKDVQPLATLIPPFAPPQGVGAPPERAVLPEVEVPWPMITLYGAATYFAIPFHELLEKYGLVSHLRLLDTLLAGRRIVRMSEMAGVQVTVFAKDGDYMVHLVNGAGERPLQTTAILHGVELTLTLPESRKMESAQWMFSDESIAWKEEDGHVILRLPPLGTWEAVFIRTKEA